MQLKRGYVNFLVLILIISATLSLSCGEVKALPQDWPCYDFELYKVEIIKEDIEEFEYGYTGETNGYIVNINLLGFHKYPNLFANCGTAGCSGEIINKATQKTENLRFFCENYNEDFSKVTCNISKGDEFIFEKTNNQYVAYYCTDNKSKTIIFNKNECDDSRCVMYWVDNNIKNESTNLKMSCHFDEQKAHCFTNNGYDDWLNLMDMK